MRHILLITCSLYEVTLGRATMTGKVAIGNFDEVDSGLDEIYSYYLRLPHWIECDISDKSGINKLLEEVRRDIVDNRIKSVLHWYADIQIDEHNYFQVYMEWVEMFSGEGNEK